MIPVPAPTIAGYQSFLNSVAGIGNIVLPPTEPVIQYSFDQAMSVVNTNLIATGYSYNLAVYNLATAYLLMFAPDQPEQTFFADARGKDGYNLYGFVPGVITSSANGASSTGVLAPDFMKGLTIGDLQLTLTPFGRNYLAIAMDSGPTIWGIS